MIMRRHISAAVRRQVRPMITVLPATCQKGLKSIKRPQPCTVGAMLISGSPNDMAHHPSSFHELKGSLYTKAASFYCRLWFRNTENNVTLYIITRSDYTEITRSTVKL